MEYGCINSGLFYILNFHGPFHLLDGKKTVQLLAKKRLKIIIHSIYYFIFFFFHLPDKHSVHNGLQSTKRYVI